MAINTDPSTHQQAIVIVCIVSPVVACLFVGIRIWTRAFVLHSVGWDDYLALITLPFCIACSTLVAIGTNYGFGWHVVDIWPSLHIFYNKWIFILSIVYLFTLGLYKFTILLLYLRLFGVNKYFRYVTWAVMIFVFAYLFTNLMTMVFGCDPIEKSWDKTRPGHCLSETKSVRTYGSMNVISDVIIFLLPLPMVWGLQLSLVNKIGVTFVFMGGFIASVVAIVRYALLLRRYHVTDTSWYDGYNLIFMVLEINTGLICSCTLAFKPFLKHLLASLTSPSSSRNPSQKMTNSAFFYHHHHYPKGSSVPSPGLGRRTDSSPLKRQNTGFVALGNDDDEIEMEVERTRTWEVEHEV